MAARGIRDQMQAPPMRAAVNPSAAMARPQPVNPGMAARPAGPMPTPQAPAGVVQPQMGPGMRPAAPVGPNLMMNNVTSPTAAPQPNPIAAQTPTPVQPAARPALR